MLATVIACHELRLPRARIRARGNRSSWHAITVANIASVTYPRRGPRIEADLTDGEYANVGDPICRYAGAIADVAARGRRSSAAPTGSAPRSLQLRPRVRRPLVAASTARVARSRRRRTSTSQ